MTQDGQQQHGRAMERYPFEGIVLDVCAWYSTRSLHFCEETFCVTIL